ncbi:formate--tetrahydrofolate ligase [Microvirga sp. W0021]|uniref:Formate--tetrahydrofolate ligase n=1 Tax=Hohaiivirga grylli TaxID=3133970 RepID=A0ABV0BKS0_9HYPH
MPTDIEIARSTPLKTITDIAASIDIPSDVLNPYGRYIAKLDRSFIAQLMDRPRGKLILVTAISPTAAGEGKTTTVIGLGDALKRVGCKTMLALREPSLGPCFGQKGGATGGGRSQVAPMDAINLHFTGDFHAISAAHNLLAAMVDNHVYWGNELNIDTRRINWGRVVDMNDRALRDIVVGLGGPSNGYSHSSRYDITVASEIMAIFCLAKDFDDLQERLARIVVAETTDRQPVTAGDLKAVGAMAALLADAMQPNLVQTLEGTPALVHGGPFANIAHGCNSVIATETALRLADYVVTEAGFGADLGAEKFLDIKCRQTGLSPDACVVVATLRALKMHGGVAKADLAHEDIEALKRGFANLERHVKNMQSFGLPVVVALNHFVTDTEAEFAVVRDLCRDRLGVEAIFSSHWSDGGAGAEKLARQVIEAIASSAVNLKLTYSDDQPLTEKIRSVAQKIYGAADIAVEASAAATLAKLEKEGWGNLPVCIAKTQYSFSTDKNLMGAPSGHIIPIREIRLSAGAGFVVALCGDIMTMPGLPRKPAAEAISVTRDGLVDGLF